MIYLVLSLFFFFSGFSDPDLTPVAKLSLPDEVNTIRFSKNGNYLAATHDEGFDIIDVGDWSTILHSESVGSEVESVHWVNNDGILVIGGDSGQVMFYETVGWTLLQSIDVAAYLGHTMEGWMGDQLDISVSPDESFLTAQLSFWMGGGKMVIYEFDAATATATNPVTFDIANADALAWHPNSQEFVINGDNKDMDVWTLSSGSWSLSQTVEWTSYDSRYANVFAYNSDGNKLLMALDYWDGDATANHNGLIFDTSTWSVTDTIKYDSITNYILGAAWSPDESVIVFADDDDIMAWGAWDAAQNKFVEKGHIQLDDEAGEHATQISPDGRYLAVGDDEGTLWVWLIYDEDNNPLVGEHCREHTTEDDCNNSTHGHCEAIIRNNGSVRCVRRPRCNQAYTTVADSYDCRHDYNCELKSKFRNGQLVFKCKNKEYTGTTGGR